MNNTDADSSYGSIVKYTGLFGGVQGLGILVGLVRTKLVALILGPAGMGLASLLNTAVNFLSQSTGLGLSFGAVRHLAEVAAAGDQGRLRRFVLTVRSWSIAAALLGAVACVAASPALSLWLFGSAGHAFDIMALAPAVGMGALTVGETALLTGTRRLKRLASVQVAMALASLLVAVPVYLAIGIKGVIPVILLVALANLVITAGASRRMFPFTFRGAWASLADGSTMVRLGVAYTLSGVFGTGAEMMIRSYINTDADLAAVGLYNAGYMITVTYAEMVFSALGADFLPRLSAVNTDAGAVSRAVNREVEVLLLLVSPLLTALMAVLPWVFPLLFSSKFTPVVPMVQVAVLSVYARAVLLPVTIITLAKGHSRAFLVTEGLSAVGLVTFVVLFFDRWGLTGAGMGVLLSNVFDLAVILVYASVRYRFRLSRRTIATAAVHLPIGAAAYMATLAPALWLRLVLGAACFAAGAALSLRVLCRETSLSEKLKKLFSAKKKPD